MAFKLLFIPIIIFHLFLLINTTFTLWPEMVVYPYLLNNSFVLYKDIINPYPPAFTLFLALFSKVFGYLPTAFQILTWTIILTIDFLVLTISFKIYKSLYKALLALSFFVFLSILFGINGLWHDLVQTPFILASMFYFYNFTQKKNTYTLFFCFLFLCFAIAIKQQALWLALGYFLILFFYLKKGISFNYRQVLISFSPFLFLIIFHLLYAVKENILSDFFKWVIYFPFISQSKQIGYLLIPTARQFVIVLSLGVLLTLSFINSKGKSKTLFFLTPFLLLFAYPRFDLFHLIPFLAISSILSVNLKPRLKSSKANLALLTSLFVISFATAQNLKNNWQYHIRFFEQDILAASSFMTKITQKNDIVYIQNGPDQIFPLSSTLPPKPWADEFPWYLETGTLQQTIVNSIKEQKPKYVVSKPYEEGKRFDLGSYKPEKIAKFVDQNYKNKIQLTNSLWLKELNELP